MWPAESRTISAAATAATTAAAAATAAGRAAGSERPQFGIPSSTASSASWPAGTCPPLGTKADPLALS